MGLFDKILLFFCISTSELQEIVSKREKEKEKAIEESNKDRLFLCFKHRQEDKYSHYSEHNCDYCKALKKIKELQNELDNKDK